MLNKLNEELRREEKLNNFKVGLRKWVVDNIPTKPRTKFPKFEAKIGPSLAAPAQRNMQHDIRSFLIDRSIGDSSEEIRPAVPPIPTDRPPPAVREGILRYFQPILTLTHEHDSENEDNENEDV